MKLAMLVALGQVAFVSAAGTSAISSDGAHYYGGFGDLPIPEQTDLIPLCYEIDRNADCPKVEFSGSAGDSHHRIRNDILNEPDERPHDSRSATLSQGGDAEGAWAAQPGLLGSPERWRLLREFLQGSGEGPGSRGRREQGLSDGSL